MKLSFSIIIPVYNRPQEIEELLFSISNQDYNDNFEVLIVEDGSTNTSKTIVDKFHNLNIQYFFKENSGPGLSRNFGMQNALGNYFIILDSDVILPKNYLTIVNNQLKESFTDAFGGPDTAHPSFSNLQKAINYSMTSFLTTGGIRGNKNSFGKFQLRSFNMGLSKKAFLATKGFSDMKAGEDIDLTFRLWQNGFKTQLIVNAFVYHKRRNSISSFFKQTFAFGAARPILNQKYPTSKKMTFWFPSLFIVGLDTSLLLLIFGFYIPILFFGMYFLAIFIDAFFRNKLNVIVAFMSLVTTITQFLGYGLGFLESYFFNSKD